MRRLAVKCRPMLFPLIWLLGLDGDIVLSPGIYSYESLCQRLVSTGRKIDLEPSLADHLAAVCLSPKKPNELIRLMSSDLNLQFSPKPDGTLRVVSDPTWLANNTAKRNAFFALYRSRLKALIDEAARMSDGFTTENNPNRRPALWDTYKDPKESPLRRAAAGLLYGLPNLDSTYLWGFAQIRADRDPASLLRGDLVQIQTGNELQDAVLSDNERFTLVSAMAKVKDEQQVARLKSEFSLVQRLTFVPASGGICVAQSDCFGPGNYGRGFRDVALVPGFLEITIPTLSDLASRLGDGPSLAKRFEGTQTALEALGHSSDVEIPAGEKSFASCLILLAQKAKVELLTPLSPIRDAWYPGGQTDPSRVKPNRFFEQRTGDPARLFASESSLPPFLQDPGLGGEVLVAPYRSAWAAQNAVQPWSVSLVQNRLVVRNEYAFIDSLYGQPGRALEKLLAARGDADGQFYYPLDAVDTFCGALTTVDCCQLARGLPSIGPDGLPAYALLSRLLPRHKPWTSFVSSLHPGQYETLPGLLSESAISDFVKLARSVEAVAPSPLVLWRDTEAAVAAPNVYAGLRFAKVMATFRPYAGRQSIGTLDVIVSTPRFDAVSASDPYSGPATVPFLRVCLAPIRRGVDRQ